MSTPTYRISPTPITATSAGATGLIAMISSMEPSVHKAVLMSARTSTISPSAFFISSITGLLLSASAQM